MQASPSLAVSAPSVHPPPAKLARPSPSNLVLRDRLFQRLDPADTARFVWVSAPAGAGKTSLVDSWLRTRALRCVWYQVDPRDEDVATFFHYLSLSAGPSVSRELLAFGPEHLSAPEVFARRFFVAWLAGREAPFAVVLDDYHSVSPRAPFHAIVRLLFEMLPPHGRLVCVGRDGLPPALADCALLASFEHVDGQRLRFTDVEAEAWAIGVAGVDPGRAAEANRVARGWAAGLRLLWATDTGGLSPLPAEAGDDAQALFEALANQVLATLEPSLRLFLMQTAAAPACTPSMASALSGRGDAGALLEALRRRGMFTDHRLQNSGETWYEYHPLFRSLLQARARVELPADQFTLLCGRAAQLHQEIGQSDAAAELYRNAALWEPLADLVRREARTWLESGRATLVERAISALPQSLLDADPWFEFWRACSRSFSDQAAARAGLIAAYRRFARLGNELARFLCLSQIFLSFPHELGYFSEMDAWIDEFERLLDAQGGRIPGPAEVPVLAACLAIAFRRLEHPMLPALAERAEHLALTLPGATDRLMLAGFVVAYAIWRGRADHAHALAEALHPSDTAASGPAARIMFRMWRSVTLHQVAKFDESLAEARAGVDMGQRSGYAAGEMQCWLQVGLVASNVGDHALAEAAMEHVPPSGDPLLMYEYMRRGVLATMLTAKGAPLEAVQLIRPALRPDLTDGSSFMHAMTLAMFGQALVLDGQYAEGHRQLDTAEAMARRIGAAAIPFHIGFARAAAFFATGDAAQAEAALREVLRIGRERGLRNLHPVWIPTLMSDMCARALDAGIETEYVTWLIRARGLQPPSADAEAWPWPVRLYTFGRKAVVLDGERLVWRGKAQKRPLELLSELVAMGGRSVDRGQLIDALWPELDGDAASNAFAMTLHRLRKMLGRPEALLLEDGKLGFDDRTVWIDVWAFRRLAGSVAKGVRPAELPDTSRRLQRLCSGPFLAGETTPAVARARERLHRDALQAMRSLAERLRGHGDQREADALLERAAAIHLDGDVSAG